MLLRRIKAAMVHALLWASVWAVAGVLLEFLQATHGLVGHSPLELVPLIPGMVAYWFGVGFAGGLLVAGIVMAAERNKALDRISLRRMALWGAVPGILLPLLSHIHLAFRGLFMVNFLTGNVEMAVILGCVGAGLAAAELKVARALPPGTEPVPTLSRPAP